MTDVLTPAPREEKTPAQREADAIRQDVRLLAEEIARRWRRSFSRLWNPAGELTTNEILAELGTDGARVFELSSAIVTLLLSVAQTRPDIIEGVQARLDMIPEYKINEDGTVTLVDVWPVPPPPPPEPEEEEIELEPAD